MKKMATTDDFSRIVIEGIPLIDVRAPVEFKGGAFPNAVNLPLLDDKDRHLVGTCYRHQGREAAFALAEKRVSGAKKEERIAAWHRFLRRHGDAMFYCLRGGMRSQTAQQWYAQQTGRLVARLQGGYKAFRRFLIDALDPGRITAVPVILGGRTGSGKTALLRRLESGIDLEALANHRGSAFGGFLSPQPSQIDFENRLAYALIRHAHLGFRHVVLEDEGHYIGARYIPHALAAYFHRDSMVLLECPLDRRILITWQEYVVDAQQQFCRCYGVETGLALWHEHIESRMQRIRKRLGGERLKRVLALLEAGRREQEESGQAEAHKAWIEVLLSEYYDPMYDYQIEKGGRSIAFRGGPEEVLAYLRGLEPSLVGPAGTAPQTDEDVSEAILASPRPSVARMSR